jgi:hypothetical protein
MHFDVPMQFMDIAARDIAFQHAQLGFSVLSVSFNPVAFQAYSFHRSFQMQVKVNQRGSRMTGSMSNTWTSGNSSRARATASRTSG